MGTDGLIDGYLGKLVIRLCVLRIRPPAPISDIGVIMTQRSRRFSPRIAMVKATHARQSDDVGVGRRSRLNRSS